MKRATPQPHPAFRLRAGQAEFERGVERHRVCAFITRRQYGKTTLAARIALKKMMRTPGHTVVFGSVKLDLGREIVRKEAEAMQKAIALLALQAREANALLNLADSDKGMVLPEISADDFAELYEACRLEFRLYHSRTTFSRTKVVALTASAVGDTGDLITDEVGRVAKFREVHEAVSPIISSNPNFRWILTTTPPPDDAHYSYELLAPPIGESFAINPAGNWYRSECGIRVLRVTAHDAYADGLPLYDDDTGAPIAPVESRARASDKDAWDRNYDCKFVIGGSAACGRIELATAQARGQGQCALFVIGEDADFLRALEFLRAHLTAGPVGLGLDLATTEHGTSNPTSITVTERLGTQFYGRLTCVWKTADPDLARERARRIIAVIRGRSEGGPARRLAIDATNERYWATDLRKALAAELPVELVIASQTVERPGAETMNMKQWLGSQLVGELDDNHLVLAPERYLFEDFRLVKKDRGTFVADTAPDGKHGDVFDSHKLALHALLQGGPVYIPAQNVRHSERARLSRERRVTA